ncbi:MAG TPA: NINE protein [Candidatus Binatia bacterium]|jgi:TM2 domain-containing membrane protein YozV/ribosomal protein L40E
MDETPRKAADEKFCSECGAIIKAKAEICPKCGVRQLPAPNAWAGIAPNGKSKLVAGLLALVLGGLGVHKFYLGQIGWGVLYAIFFWTFIPAVVGFIEGIMLLAMTQEEFNEKYGKL